jgi:hypothetical protein
MSKEHLLGEEELEIHECDKFVDEMYPNATAEEKESIVRNCLILRQLGVHDPVKMIRFEARVTSVMCFVKNQFRKDAFEAIMELLQFALTTAHESAKVDAAP